MDTKIDIKWTISVLNPFFIVSTIFYVSFSYQYKENYLIDRTIQIIYQFLDNNLSFSIWFDKSAGT